MQIITTGDGSHTLFSQEFNEIYHSRHGAIEESRHVFIRHGLNHLLSSAALENGAEVRIFEMGLGTGLNALLTMLEAEALKIKIEYTAIELFPVPIETIKALNYTDVLGYKYCYGPYHSLHLCRWSETHQITPYFAFRKINQSFFDFEMEAEAHHLIYFDAFAPAHQPEIWAVDTFAKLHRSLKQPGCLVTYCSKVSVQKALIEAGFTLENLPGPPGKREMLRAYRR